MVSHKWERIAGSILFGHTRGEAIVQAVRLVMAQQSIKQDNHMNEDNEIYANYPLQISLFDVENRLKH